MNILDRLVLWFLGLDIAVISLVVVAMLGLPCLVIVGRAVIKDQWKQEAAQLEGAPVVSTSLIVEIERGEDRGPEDRGTRT